LIGFRYRKADATFGKVVRHRYLSNGLVFEILDLAGRFHDNELEEVVRRCPMDGKTHTFAELRG
jgi:hypothetical protein